MKKEYGRRLRFEERSDAMKDQHVQDILDMTAFFKEKFNLDLYVMYGTLLGTVRHGDFIADDKDIDVSFVSSYSDYDSIVAQMVGVYQVFYDMGLVRDVGQAKKDPYYTGHAHIFYPNERTEFDIWTSWLGVNGKFNFWWTGKDLDKSVFYPFRTLKLRGKDVQVPNKYKVLLKYLYGSGWKAPVANDKAAKHNPKYFPPLPYLCKNPIVGIKQ